MERLNLPDPREKARPADLAPTSVSIDNSLGSDRDRDREVRQAIAELRADLDWLADEVKRLRGRVTGGIRRAKEEADAPANNGAPTMEQVNAAIRAGTWRRTK